MEVLFGIKGKDFVLLAADATSARSIVVMKQGEDKTKDLNDNVVMAITGEAGDTVMFSEQIQRNVQLYGISNGIHLSTTAAANFTRSILAQRLRSRQPYHINMLIGGTDPKTGVPELFWVDYLSSMQKMEFSAHGYASYFCMSTMDRYWHENMNEEEVVALLKKCIEELKVRFVGNFPLFTVKIVDKNGIRLIDLGKL